MKITLIAALTRDRVIGNDGEIPWDIPEELEHFKNTTFGHPIIVGRNTRENIGELPERLNIVLSRSETFNGEQTVTARNKQAAIEAAMDSFEDEVFIIGGESIYRHFIDDADRLILSWIDKNYEGDTHFPDFTYPEWKMMEQRIRNKYTIIDYEKR